MENPMTRNIFTAAARRGITSTLAALALAAALPQLAFAAGSDAGIWKIDPSKSTYKSGAVTLRIERVGAANPGTGKFVVVSNGSVYLVTGATAYDSKDLKLVAYGRMMKDGTAVLIGTNARSLDVCSFRCQGGRPDNRMTLSFKGVSAGEQHIRDMLAYEGQTE
jgi:hypothetical protein